MKQLSKVCTILVVFGILILTVMHFAMGRSYGYLEVQPLLLSILMFLSAYKHVQDKGKRDIAFWTKTDKMRKHRFLSKSV